MSNRSSSSGEPPCKMARRTNDFMEDGELVCIVIDNSRIRELNVQPQNKTLECVFRELEGIIAVFQNGSPVDARKDLHATPGLKLHVYTRDFIISFYYCIDSHSAHYIEYHPNSSSCFDLLACVAEVVKHSKSNLEINDVVVEHNKESLSLSKSVLYQLNFEDWTQEHPLEVLSTTTVRYRLVHRFKNRECKELTVPIKSTIEHVLSKVVTCPSNWFVEFDSTRVTNLQEKVYKKYSHCQELPLIIIFNEDTCNIEKISEYISPASSYANVSSQSVLTHARNREKSAIELGCAICHHRDIAPLGNSVSLYYPGFDEFINDCESIPVDSSDYEFAYEMCLAMKDTFDLAENRRDAFHAILQKKLSPGISTRSNANFNVGYSLYVQIKNEPGSTNANPYKEIISYYVQDLMSRKSHSQCPSFLVELSGPNMTISGAAYGEDVHVDRLVPPLWLVPQIHDTPAMVNIAKTLKSFVKAVENLQNYCKSSSSIIQPRFPCYREIDIDGQKCQITYTCQIQPHVFRGVLKYEDSTKEEMVVVKFANRRYGRDAHLFLASKGYAPELFYCERKGHFVMVVMQEIQKADLIDDYLRGKTASQERTSIIGQFKTILETLKEGKYVHGDLRPPNFLVKDGKVFVVDFDWAGKCNQTFYPPFINFIEITWPEGVGGAEEIKYEHDKHWIDQLEKQALN